MDIITGIVIGTVIGLLIAAFIFTVDIMVFMLIAWLCDD